MGEDITGDKLRGNNNNKITIHVKKNIILIQSQRLFSHFRSADIP